ncbi:MAG: response regulator transcription factor, partial [Bdellovibrionales bacterium]|nr:response regulator transcription factor [Bdellovibrionales bacterium]
SQFETQRPDFICLDIMMPGMSGYDVCRKIRARDEQTPIIFISAKSEEIDKVLGLELGADDYIMKPFGMNEVIARIRAITRRCYRAERKEELSAFQMRDLEVRPRELRAVRGEEVIELSLREVKILSLLKAHAGKLLERDTFFNKCWGVDYLPNSRTLDQHISKLRKKIERDPKQPDIIETIHGAGYRYSE